MTDSYGRDFDDPNFNMEGGYVGRGGPTSTPASDVGGVKAGIDSFGATMAIAKGASTIASAFFSHSIAKSNAAIRNAHAELKYWVQWKNQSQANYRAYENQMRTWYRSQQYVEQQKKYEQLLKQQRATYKGEVSTRATKDFARKMSDLDAQFYEKEARDEIQMRNIRAQLDTNAAKKSGAAAGRVGRNVQALQQVQDQRWLLNLSNRQITKEFRLADKMRAGEAFNAARENEVSSIQLYNPRPVSDPVKPLAPIPIDGYQPTPDPGPSGLTLATAVTGAAFDAISEYRDFLPDPAED